MKLTLRIVAAILADNIHLRTETIWLRRHLRIMNLQKVEMLILSR